MRFNDDNISARYGPITQVSCATPVGGMIEDDHSYGRKIMKSSF
jgi:hypothetical protein